MAMVTAMMVTMTRWSVSAASRICQEGQKAKWKNFPNVGLFFPIFPLFHDFFQTFLSFSWFFPSFFCCQGAYTGYATDSDGDDGCITMVFGMIVAKDFVAVDDDYDDWNDGGDVFSGGKDDLDDLKVDMPILTCIFFTFNWLTLTSEMHFVKFHHVVASCLLSTGKRKYVPLGMRLLWKYIRNYFLVYQLISPFLVYLQNYKEFEAEILDLQSEKYGLSFDIKKYTTSGWALGDENVIGIRAFKW